jgi:hypothetical protein
MPPAPDDYTALIQSHLRADEQVVWQGQPDAQRLARNYLLPGLAGVVFISLLLLLLGLDLFLVAVFSPGLVLIMLGMTFFSVYPEARRTIYVITNHRVLFLHTERWDFIQALEASDIGDIQLTSHRDGTGDIFFASESYRRGQRRGKTRHFGFVGIHDPQAVEAHLRTTFPQL